MPEPKFQIVVDTREQSPLIFPSREIKTVSEALDAGDYAIKINETLCNCRIERKSCADLFSSFSGDNYRREKEKIKRAHQERYRYILAIEGSCSRVREGQSYFKGGVMHRVKKDGLTMVKQIETIGLRYGVELRYCECKRDMAFMVQEILLAYVRNYGKV